MKQFSKIFVVLLVIILTAAVISTPVGAQGAKPYDVTQEGILCAYYSVDPQRGYITGIAPGTTSQKLLNTCVPSGLYASEEIVATGTVVTYAAPDGTDISLTAIITGDLNEDAGITITDMLMLKSAVLGEPLSDLAFAAGDLNFDGSVTITDFLKVKAFLLGLETVDPAQANSELFLLMPGSTDTWQIEGAFSYESADPELLSIAADGTVTALEKEGSAFVYAFSENGTMLARQLVTVLDEPLTLSLGMESCTLIMGQSLTLTPVFNHPVTPNITWTSSDDTVITVENGVLTAQHFGTATVIAALDDGTQAELAVTVTLPITDITIERSLYKIKPGKSKNLTVFMTPSDSGEELIWTSSNPDIATVSPDGTVTGVAYGTVTVTATGKYSGLSDTCNVKICDVIQVALTYDDGPSANTTKLLNFLKENDIRVTFFLVGNRINSYQSIVKRQAAEGHEIGYHSYAHVIQTGLNSAQILSDFEKSDDILYSLTGKHFTLWRTPGGDYNNRVISSVPLPHIMWNEDTLDWKNRNTYSVYSYIINRANDGDIILMHDLYSTTVEGSIMAMKEMLQGNYEFLTVTELLSRDGTPPENCTTYFSDK